MRQRRTNKALRSKAKQIKRDILAACKEQGILYYLERTHSVELTKNIVRILREEDPRSETKKGLYNFINSSHHDKEELISIIKSLGFKQSAKKAALQSNTMRHLSVQNDSKTNGTEVQNWYSYLFNCKQLPKTDHQCDTYYYCKETDITAATTCHDEDSKKEHACCWYNTDTEYTPKVFKSTPIVPGTSAFKDYKNKQCGGHEANIVAAKTHNMNPRKRQSCCNTYDPNTLFPPLTLIDPHTTRPQLDCTAATGGIVAVPVVGFAALCCCLIKNKKKPKQDYRLLRDNKKDHTNYGSKVLT